MKKKLLGIFLLSLPIPIVFGLVGLTDQLPFITGFIAGYTVDLILFVLGCIVYFGIKLIEND